MDYANSKIIRMIFVKLKVNIKGGARIWGGGEGGRKEEEVREEKMSLDIFYCVNYFVIAITKILTKTKFWESVFFGL